MDRRYLLLIVGAIAILGIVNATVFAYRWMTGTITISGADQATGAACTGFYNAPSPPLPRLGTNAGAPTYGNNSITINTRDVVCSWTIDTITYYLYESIEVSIPVTVGSWYIKDFYAFGYYGRTANDPTVYVYFKVEDAIDVGTEVPGTYTLYIYDSAGNLAGSLNLAQLNNMTGPIPLSPNSGLRFDLKIDASGTGTATFKVGAYVTQEAGESP